MYIYTRSVIPQIEARIEERLLHEYMRTIKNELERKELFDAYIMRRHRLSRLPEDADAPIDRKDDMPGAKQQDAHEIAKSIKTIDGTGFSMHNYSDVGRYTVFPEKYKNRLFPSGAFGRIDKDEVQHTGSLGIMCREQGLRLTNDMARLTLPNERSIDYGKIAHSMTPSYIRKELLQDETSYMALVQDFSLDLHDLIHKQPSERRQKLRHFFLPPGVFDGLVNVLV